MSAPAPGAASAGDEPPELATDGTCPFPLLPNPQPCSSPPRRTLVSPRALLLCSKRRRTFAPGSSQLGPLCPYLAVATASSRPWGRGTALLPAASLRPHLLMFYVVKVPKNDSPRLPLAPSSVRVRLSTSPPFRITLCWPSQRAPLPLWSQMLSSGCRRKRATPLRLLPKLRIL